MREILFRGKRIDDGEWVVGLFIKDFEIYGHKDEHSYIVTHKHPSGCFGNDIYFEVIPETVGQYTGLTDKNGTKIFEGDICRFREWSKGDMCWVGKVHYEHQQFVISGNPNKECESEFLLVMSRFIPENIEIIGNIHDNPELMKGGEK